MRKPIVIKDNAAGRRAFEVLQSIAERMWLFAQQITAEHAAVIAPNAKTMTKNTPMADIPEHCKSHAG